VNQTSSVLSVPCLFWHSQRFEMSIIKSDPKPCPFKLEAKMEGVEAQLEKKIDAVASDLAAHRRDTEAHSSVYKVKESK